MRIAIDVSQIIYETGVSTYTRNLCSSLLQIDKDNKYILFGASLRSFRKMQNILDRITNGKRNAEFNLYPIPSSVSEFFGNKFRLLSIDKFLGDIDVFHSSDWSQPPAEAFKVTTIHDVIPFLYPKLTHPKILSVHKKRLDLVKREVDRIIVPSQTTKNDLLKFGFAEKRIRVIPEAPDPLFKRVTKNDAEAVKRKYRLHRRYLLAIGTSRRKNIDGIIDAYERVRAERDLRLVVIGENRDGKRYRGVYFMGHLPTFEVAAILKGSEALVYTSLYEGFGLPILEAYQCSVPVVTSDIGSMKEVGEDASVLVDPEDVSSIKDGILEALKNKKGYIKSGKEILEDYSWEKNAKKTLAVYKEYME